MNIGKMKSKRIKFSAFKFKTQILICYYIVAIVVFLFCTTFIGIYLWRLFYNDMQLELENQAEQISENIDNTITSTMSVVDVISNNSEFVELLHDKKYEAAKLFFDQNISYFLDSQRGRIRACNLAFVNVNTTNIAQDNYLWPYYNDMKQFQTYEIITDVYTSDKNEKMFHYLKKIPIDNNNFCLINLAIYETEILQFFSNYDANTSVKVYNTTTEKTITSNKNLIVESGYNMQDILDVSAECDIGWTVEIKIKQQMLSSIFFSTYSSFIWLIVVTFVIIYFLVSVIVAGIQNRIKSLLTKVDFISRGQFDEVTVLEGDDEFTALSIGLVDCAHKIDNLITENRLFEKKRVDAQIQALRAQIHSHFLFNSLSSIKWFAEMQQKEKIITSIDELAKFLRFSLSMEKDVIYIKQELEFLNAYIYLQSIRFADSIKFFIDIDDEYLSYDTCKFILQPFVENAIYHARKTDHSQLVIAVYIIDRGDDYDFVIEDNGVGMSQKTISDILDSNLVNGDSGYGIKNVVERLSICSQAKATFMIESELNFYTKIIIRQPKVNDCKNDFLK